MRQDLLTQCLFEFILNIVNATIILVSCLMKTSYSALPLSDNRSG